ncbi:MAG: hypothetical protein HYX67_02375 [Candidatus Melainabacteria bacterium]|nr:hypothetical protein [Candidatus Melainabacteria bacterium]
MNKCRVFLKSPGGKLKKIYEIRAKDTGRFIQTQVWATLLCKEFGIPFNSEIHYQYPSNGKDFHLSIKYVDLGPFSDPEITKVENYLCFYPTQDKYKHKQVIWRKNRKLPATTHLLPFTQEVKTKYLLGYQPYSYADYRNENQIYYFPTISTPITPTIVQGDSTKTSPTENDIVILEADKNNARINVCSFVCSPGYYPRKEEANHKSRVVISPSMPDFGISVVSS